MYRSVSLSKISITVACSSSEAHYCSNVTINDMLQSWQQRASWDRQTDRQINSNTDRPPHSTDSHTDHYIHPSPSLSSPTPRGRGREWGLWPGHCMTIGKQSTGMIRSVHTMNYNTVTHYIHDQLKYTEQ